MKSLLENVGSLDFLHPSILNIPRWEVPPVKVEFVDFPGGEDKDLSLYWDFRAKGEMDGRSSRGYLHRVFLREPS